MIIALAKLNYPSYTPELWQGTLVYWGVIVVTIVVNTAASKILPMLESFILVLHIVGFFAVLIPLVSVSYSSGLSQSRALMEAQLAPEKVSAKEVFTVFENGGGWPSTTLSVFVGLLGSVFATYGDFPILRCPIVFELMKALRQVPTALYMYVLQLSHSFLHLRLKIFVDGRRDSWRRHCHTMVYGHHDTPERYTWARHIDRVALRDSRYQSSPRKPDRIPWLPIHEDIP